MGNIQDLLAQILSARYGRDVRQSIHDAIETCYEDGHAGAIDLQARTLLGDTDISEISETVTGAVVELDGAVGTAQTTADGASTAAGEAMTAAQTAQSTADGAVSGLENKQNILSIMSKFTGDIDTLYADTNATAQNNGAYFCDSTVVTGTLPFTTGFFTLVVIRNIQIAFPYKTPATDTSAATVKFRDHINGWRYWRGASFTV